ncbi:MAG: hypothetical protein ACK5PZ_00555, partial [Pirellula sp.]
MAIRTGVGATVCSLKWSGRSWVRMSIMGMLVVAPLPGMHDSWVLGLAQVSAQEPAAAKPEKVAVNSAERQAMIERAVGFLRKSQAEDGSFSSQGGPGVTGLVVASALSVGVPKSDPVVAKGLAYIVATRRDDGGLYAKGSRHANYETCLAMMALDRANADGKYDEMIAG